MSNKIITLTTDFGLQDEYAGVMKGVILTHDLSTTIVDITHGIGTQNIIQAAYCIHSSYRYFPNATVHVVVIDPGVGSNRRFVLLKSDGHFFLAPDNGVLTLMLEEDLFENAFEVNCEDIFLKPLSMTFHGRDILAPVAAHLANGMEPQAVGSSLDRSDLCILPLLKPELDETKGIIRGKIISIDRFGNLITNITYDDVNRLFDKNMKSSLYTSINKHNIIGVKKSYDSVSKGELLVIFGSRNSIEIAASNSSAALIINAAQGNEVTVACKYK